MLSSFTFNGRTSTEFGIQIERMPTLNRSARKFRAASVPGHNGNIYELQDAWEEIVQPYQIFAGDRNSNAVSNFSNIAEWLHSADGYAMLTDTYDPTHYREAIFVDSMDVESEWHTLGRATINFRCRPEHYIVTNPITVTSGGSVMNSTNHNAFPKITLTGGGARSLFQMAGRSLAVIQKGVVGTAELSLFIGDSASTVWIVQRYYADNPTNIRLAGSSYATLNSLTEGALEYEITSNTYADNWGVGFILAVQPNTDYALSWEAYDGGRVEVWFANKTGYNKITSSVFKETSAGEWVSDYLTFKTPAECGYALISLGHIKQTTPGKTTQKYRNVMLAYGTEAKPFRAYATPSDSVIKINDAALVITSSGFDTAVIDCEKESVLIDTTNGNPNTQVLDKYGNLSASYLQMITGVNTITFDGDITAVSVEPRFWTL